jgi:hypothetical protein
MMRLIKNGDGKLPSDYHAELEGDEAELIAFYDAADAFDYAFALGAADAVELLRELRRARRQGLSREDYWRGPVPDGELH